MFTFSSNKKKYMALVGGIAVSLSFIKLPKIFYINTSPSIPLGIYKSVDTTLKPSTIILFHPPESVKNLDRHWLRNNQIIMKPIVATEGDFCCISENNVEINGNFYGEIQKFDSEKLPLPSLNFCRSLKPHEIWVGSNHIENSFDSRYFGPIFEKEIIATVTPLIIFDGDKI